MSSLKKVLIFSSAVAFVSLSAPLLAQGTEPLRVLQDVLDGLLGEKAKNGPALRSAAEAEQALRGKWEYNLSICSQPTDTAVFGDKNDWSGYEWSCAVPGTAYNKQGFAGQLICAAEGEEYISEMRVELSEDGQSVTVSFADGGAPETLFKCPRDTESIRF